MSNRVSSVTTFSSNSWAQDVPAASRTLVCSALVMRSSQIVLTSPERADSPRRSITRATSFSSPSKRSLRLSSPPPQARAPARDPATAAAATLLQVVDHPSILPRGPVRNAGRS
jgi:hypothetical protein